MPCFLGHCLPCLLDALTRRTHPTHSLDALTRRTHWSQGTYYKGTPPLVSPVPTTHRLSSGACAIRLPSKLIRMVKIGRVYVSICIHTFQYVYIRFNMYTYAAICIHTFQYVYIRFNLYTYVSICIHTFQYVYIRFNMYTYACSSSIPMRPISTIRMRAKMTEWRRRPTVHINSPPTERSGHPGRPKQRMRERGKPSSAATSICFLSGKRSANAQVLQHLSAS